MSADQLSAVQRGKATITGALDLSTHGGPPNADFTLTLDSDSCEFGFVCQ